MAKLTTFSDPSVATGDPDRMPPQQLTLHLEYLRRHLPYHKLFAFYGLSLGEGTHQIRCPFHGADRNPSARYYHDTQRMWCFACNMGGDVAWFIKQKQGFAHYEPVIQFAAEHFGISLDETDLNKRRAILPPPAPAVNRVTFAKPYEDKLNDVILAARRQGRIKQLSQLEPMFWQRKREIDAAETDYLGYCSLVRGWADWCRTLLRDALKYEEGRT